jgi:nucleotide-binding universal stress UspA family protein
MFEKIVVGVDGHDSGRDALALSGVFASLWDADVVAVRAHAPNGANGRLSYVEGLRHRDAELELGADLAQTGVTAAPRVTRDRSAAGALHRIAAEEEAGLIVVGSTRHSPVGRVLAGDVATATLRGAPCAVAVAPRGTRAAGRAIGAIAVGVADQPEIAPATERAIALARRTGASLTLLCVVGLPRDLNVDGAFVEEVRERYRFTNDALARRIADEHGVAAAGRTVIGAPADELAHLSHAVDLIVVGSRRSGGPNRLVTGRTTETLVRHASCAVLVVPAAARLERPAPQKDKVLATTTSTGR